MRIRRAEEEEKLKMQQRQSLMTQRAKEAADINTAKDHALEELKRAKKKLADMEGTKAAQHEVKKFSFEQVGAGK